MKDCVVFAFGCSCEEGKCEAGLGHAKLHLLQEPKQNWLDRWISEICDWIKSSRLERACPELKRLKRAEEKARRKHKAVRHIQARREKVMLELLRRNA